MVPFAGAGHRSTRLGCAAAGEEVTSLQQTPGGTSVAPALPSVLLLLLSMTSSCSVLAPSCPSLQGLGLGVSSFASSRASAVPLGFTCVFS